MGILDIFTGAGNTAKRQIKYIKKAEGKNIKEGTALEKKAGDLYGEQKGIAANAVTQGNAALTANAGKQVNALGTALKGQTAAYDQDLATQHGLFDPYTQYGQEGIGLTEGMYGEDPASSAAFMQRFENSPLYQATYQAAMDEARTAAERGAAARGGLNGGGIMLELARRGGQIGRNTIGDYMGLINNRLGFGADMAGRASGAYGQNAAGRASAYSNYGNQTSSAYGNLGSNLASNFNQGASNALAAGNLFSNNVNAATGVRTGANSAIGAGKIAAKQGALATNAGLLNGAMNAVGTAVGGGGGTGGGLFSAQKPWFIS